MENPIKMDDLGVPLFLETPISCGFFLAIAGNDSLRTFHDLIIWFHILIRQKIAANKNVSFWFLLYRDQTIYENLLTMERKQIWGFVAYKKSKILFLQSCAVLFLGIKPSRNPQRHKVTRVKATTGAKMVVISRRLIDVTLYAVTIQKNARKFQVFAKMTTLIKYVPNELDTYAHVYDIYIYHVSLFLLFIKPCEKGYNISLKNTCCWPHFPYPCSSKCSSLWSK